jgi:predicted HTH domain antitoxin
MAHNVKVDLEVPEGVSEEARETARRRAREGAVLALWETGAISTREAAAELGLTYYDYLDLLAERGIPVVRGEFDEEAVEKARRDFAAKQP